ncbi:MULTISPECIES: phosphoribosylanthranilate isomerase [Cytobacillus]|jgi:phosphoribosylanthranilate isomerase|uniref:N-(5'-phosphoribosyl)anthranilate isomerase n=1 Tax=Cytobacillus oceanisediminis 2691 TaxID=1196031 RepID=A0A160MDV6_9BACI|nr:phosphoribosylanthranilate isomerase [Cytobacillus oceanisediminis]MBY0155208.1 phosphoribosylanthranilate isomerase [Cytobacillus firmus]AND40994.1 N-(5'-phosphoribosyl)anthranilate isomerase [Cytobacillus oceanisediminis 2691]MCM3393506.1 phosphoribosylanthranilate isomerase [Cytobacillus oceanisediminis]MCM3405425.1 phosphoribosylanthranilate isomerase [Cytobacillus oceanisediminis]MCM3530604.1 phosphoribosylanthranilate isomerase [Cytobacillus oceanisediminis]
MKVKICGIRDISTALFAIENGADALGFVFAESKRKINPEAAGEIIRELPGEVLKVGVFVNETKATIEEIANVSGINVIQLHGDETPEFCSSFSLPVIKALSVGSPDDLSQLDEFSCEYILLDSPKGKYRGGNGVSFDWSILNKPLQDKKMILAGGLNPENVGEGIKAANPYMVDVSSGVETEGKKDPEKIKRFIENAKCVEREEVK